MNHYSVETILIWSVGVVCFVAGFWLRGML
jgi:hypothetical protein